jgi:hypothetical protein
MRRFLWLWLTLLGAFWAARALVSALIFQRAGHDGGSFLALAAIPTAQAAVLWWVTRERPKKADSTQGD